MGRFLPDLLGTLGSSFGIGPKATRATLDASGLTAARTFALPDKSDTLATLGDVNGSPILYASGTLNDIVNTTAKTTLASFTIPANTLGTNKAISIELDGDYLNNSGTGQTLTLEIKYGSTVLWAGTSGSLTASANRHALALNLTLAAVNGATNAQILSGDLNMGRPVAPTTGLSDIGGAITAATGFSSPIRDGGCAEDSTADQNFTISVTHSAAAATISARCRYVIAHGIGQGQKGDQAAPSNDYISGLQVSYVDAGHVQVGTGAAAIQSSGTLETVTAAINVAIPSPAANTWYHLYLYSNAGTPAVECVTTAPATPYSGTARSKTGDTTRRYVGSVLTDASGNLLKFKQVRDSVWYETDVTSGSLKVLGSGAATTSTSVDCSGAVPLTADVAQLYVVNTSTTAPLRLSNADGPAVPAAFLANIAANTSGATTHMVDMPLSVQAFTYAFNGSPGTGIAFIGVRGYGFSR